MKTSTKMSEVLCLSGNPRQCTLQVRGNTLQHVETLKYLVVVIASEGRRNEEVDTWSGKTTTVLRELGRSAVTKRELSNIANLLVCNRSPSVPILTHDHESWVMTEKILSQMQAAEIGFLRRAHGVALRDKVGSCENRRAQNVEPLLLRIKRS